MQKNKTLEMVQLAILTAIMIVFAFTPIGFLKIGAIEMTFMILPVAIGATLLGPKGGTVLGVVFGLLSFAQCFVAPSYFATIVIGISPIATFALCLVPRVLCGFLSGWVFKLLKRVDKTNVVSYFVTTLCTALFNTVFFTLGTALIFWKQEAFVTAFAEYGLPTDSFIKFMVWLVAVNGVVEAVVNCILGGAIGKAVSKLLEKKAS